MENYDLGPLTSGDLATVYVEFKDLSGNVGSGGLAMVDDIRFISLDVNLDGTVDIVDVMLVAGAFDSPPASPPPYLDVNGDGSVDVQDILAVAQAWLEQAGD